MSQLFAEHDQSPTDRPGRALLDTLHGSAAVAVTYAADGHRAIVSVWNGSATVNTIGIRLAPGGLAVTGFDVWTSYELEGETVGAVVTQMHNEATAELADADHEAGR